MPAEIPIMDLQYTMAEQTIASAQQVSDGSFWARAIRETGPKVDVPSPRKLLKNAAERTNMKGVLGVTLPLSTLSNVFVLPSEGSLTYAFHEMGTQIDIPRAIAIGAVGGAFAASTIIEAKALEKKGFSVDPVGTAFHIATGKPYLSSIIDHLWDVFQLSFPLDVIAFINKDVQLLTDSVIAAAATFSAWNITINTLIATGMIDPVIEKAKKIGEATWRRIRNKERNSDLEEIKKDLDEIERVLNIVKKIQELTPGKEVDLTRHEE